MKKRLLMALSLAMIAVMAITGTMAYLTSTDSDVNVMTVGNVKIDQIEQEWNEEQNSLVSFTQAKPLYPYVGTFGWENKDVEDGAYRRMTMENVVDKYVSVKNTGKSDAYVRTFIALEMGQYDNLQDFAKSGIGLSINKLDGDEFDFAGAWEWTDDFMTEIDGQYYNVMVAVHKDPVKAGKTTIPSLLQVYLSKDATNESVEKLDGNNNGTYDILVFSEATQTVGFANAEAALDTAFYDISSSVHPWIGENIPDIPVAVSTADKLKAELQIPGNKIVLSADVTLEKGIAIADGVVFDLNGYTVVDKSTGGRTFAAQKGSSITIKGDGKIITGTYGSEYAMPLYVSNGSAVIDGGTYDMGTPASKDYNVLLQNTSRLVINDGVFKNNCAYPLFYVIYSSTIEINGGFFESVGIENPDLLDVEYHQSRISKIIIKGGTFVNYNPLDDNEGLKLETESNGQYEARVIVADGYKVVSETQSNGDIWYTVVAE